MCDLYTVTLLGGDVLRYCNWPTSLVFGGHTYVNVGPKLKRGNTSLVCGVEVDQIDIDLDADSSILVNGVPVIQVIHQGGFDGSRWEIQRAFLSDATTIVGTLWTFGGRFSEPEISRHKARFRIKSDLELLNIRMPRNIYQPGCLHTLFNTGCTLNKEDFAVSGVIATGSTAAILQTNLTNAADYFRLGTITITSGTHNGTSRSIKAHTSAGVLTLANPLISAPLVGVTFKAYPGCDKTKATCTNKFNNLPNFRAYPYIPVPETAV